MTKNLTNEDLKFQRYFTQNQMQDVHLADLGHWIISDEYFATKGEKRLW